MSRALIAISFALLTACSAFDTGDDTAPPATPAPDAMTPLVTCGNDRLDPGEACDGVLTDGHTCSELGLGTGDLACRPDCAGFDASGCEHEPEPEPKPCTPHTCASLGLTCGVASDGCGGTIDCGTCTEPPGPIRWTAVSAGGEHTCALRDDGSMWCWGRNNFQQVGAGGTPFGSDARPIRLPTTNDWTAVAVGHQHSCGLRASGDAYCWGRNDKGQLGDGTTVSNATPVQYTEPQDYPYVKIAAGAYHTCALRTVGGLTTCAGATTLGDPDPVPGYTSSFVATLSSGGDQSCVIGTNAGMRCDVIAGTGVSYSNRPWVEVEVGTSFWCATTADGTLYCWGANESGQLGDTTTQRRSTPTYVGTGYASVTAGDLHTCAIRTDDTLWCWGEGTYGRLGNDEVVDSTSPSRVIDTPTP